jgi:hypothetical protein
MPHYSALTCEALARSVYAAAAGSPNIISVRLFKQGLHNRPKSLRVALQEHIDTIQPGECDAILLVYGMCGTATVGLSAHHTPLVIPRAHDCITLYLGSGERYQQEFERHPGTYWYSVDYLERLEPGSSVALGAANVEMEDAEYERLVAKYGEETADSIMEEMRKWLRHYSRAAFIDTGMGETERVADIARRKAEQEGWIFERLQGNRRMLDALINGAWNPEEYLVVPPEHRIEQALNDGLMRAVKD